MSNKYQVEIDAFMEKVKASNGYETEFLQAVHEVAEAVIPVIEQTPKYKKARILDRMVEPERTLMFRVPWIDDNGDVSFTKIEPGKSHGIYHGLLYIDPKVCVRCGECEKACPTGAISLTKVSKINASA